MIALLEQPPADPPTGTKGKIRPLFRGKDAAFWTKELFRCTGSAVFTPDSAEEKPSRCMVVFNPHTFLQIGPAGIDELIARLEHIDAPSTIDGMPFIAIPGPMAHEWDLDTGDPGLFDHVKDRSEINWIQLQNRYNVLQPEIDCRAVEAFVIDYQAAKLLENGVIVEDFGNFYMEGMVPVGEGTSIASGVVLKGACEIGKNVSLYPHAYIENSKIGDNCVVLPGCIIRDSVLENQVQLGPYTHLRNGALVKEGARMGNFVEMKKSVLGKGSKAMHLTYIGDAEVGEKVNIGAGTITCNYDGVNKNKTVIEDNVFIGSGTELVAPVTVKKNGYVAAGSTITEDIPEDSLGVARERQRNIIDWVKRKRDKAKLKKCDP